ncbi:MAG: DNA primase [Pseudomonadales bacterium]|nr:DNA primase [Pseudomonadales bacterium]
MAGRIPQDFINDLLARIDIVDVIDGRVALKKAGKNYQGLCPFHSEKTASFSVAPDKQFYHCFGCGASGTALTFLMEFDRLEFVEAVEALARIAGVEVPREGGGRRETDDQRALFDALQRAEAHFREALKGAAEAIAYLRKRGVAGVVARDFGIGFAADAWDGLRKALSAVPEATLVEAGLLIRNDSGRVYDRFRGRIMFPIRDTRGRVIGFGGRVMGQGDGPKYLNSPETPVFHKGRELYGLYEARRALRQIDRLLVVEGYMDVVALAQSGIANAVATLGTSATPEHFQKLYRYTEEVVCCFDGDNAGRQAAWRALESALPQLGEGRQLKFMFLPEGEDPDSLVRAEGREAFLARVAGALPAIEYLFDRLADGLDLASLDDRARLASLAMPHIERVPPGFLKDLMLGRLRAVTGLESRAVPRARGAPARQPGRPVAAGGANPDPSSALQRPGGRLQERLLGYLLHKPTLLLAVAPESRARLAAHPAPDLFVEVARYLEGNPEAEPVEILGRWSGTAAHAVLVRLLQAPLALDQHALQGEFTDGVEKLIAGLAREERRRILAEMREAPSREKLAEFWSRRREAAGPGSPETLE